MLKRHNEILEYVTNQLAESRPTFASTLSQCRLYYVESDNSFVLEVPKRNEHLLKLLEQNIPLIEATVQTYVGYKVTVKLRSKNSMNYNDGSNNQENTMSIENTDKAKSKNTERLKVILESDLPELAKTRKGIIWIVKNKVGIVYKTRKDSIKVCLRLFLVDYMCKEIDGFNPHASVDVDIFFLRAELSVYLDGPCLCWSSSIDMLGKKVEDEGRLICFGAVEYANKNVEYVNKNKVISKE